MLDTFFSSWTLSFVHENDYIRYETKKIYFVVLRVVRALNSTIVELQERYTKSGEQAVNTIYRVSYELFDTRISKNREYVRVDFIQRGMLHDGDDYFVVRGVEEVSRSSLTKNILSPFLYRDIILSYRLTSNDWKYADNCDRIHRRVISLTFIKATTVYN